MRVNKHVSLLLFCLFLGAPGCGRKSHRELTLATTTSTRDSGLLDVLLPRFEKQSGIKVKAVAVGTGQALQLGRRGDADVLLVHDPDAEKQFMADGFGASRFEVMANDFVLVGPPDDPASAAAATSVADAFSRIARRRSPFVSRGDDSGTHKKELEFWEEADIKPSGDWHFQAGAGMGQILRMADEKRAYALTDRGTYLAQGKMLDLGVLVEGDPLLVNRYHVITVSSRKHPHTRREATKTFVAFLLSESTQKQIADFGKDRFGAPLFLPSPTLAVSE